jgi:hypothetical protein
MPPAMFIIAHIFPEVSAKNVPCLTGRGLCLYDHLLDESYASMADYQRDRECPRITTQRDYPKQVDVVLIAFREACMTLHC